MDPIEQMRNINLVNIYEPAKVEEEVLLLLTEAGASEVRDECSRVFADVVRLFSGDYPGYRGCTTLYHDLKHTMYVTLAMVRLMHGAVMGKVSSFQPRGLLLGTVCALLHDVGYIQDDGDTEGTGAKYTRTHVDRGIRFMRGYLGAGYSGEERDFCAAIILHTKLAQKVEEITVTDRTCRLFGRMLGSADLLSQMADRTYLEKLLFLYHEFREGGIDGFEREFDILKNTLGFYEMAKKRLTDDMNNVRSAMRSHFRSRWNIDKDLYSEAMDRNIEYLKTILAGDLEHYRERLRRDGIVDAIANERTRAE